jgi:hypothetical protein
MAAALVLRAVRLEAFAQHRAGRQYKDIYYLPSVRWLPVLSLGYRQALADLIWCKSLIYFGEELSHKGQVKYVFEYTDAILALDPDFRQAYRWVATAAIYRPTEITMEVGLRAADYLRRAVERWPADGELHWDYGSLLRFELAPLEKDPKRKRSLMERAAPHLEAAARHGAGPPWLALNNVDLLNKLGRTEQSIHHLEELYATVQDKEVKREIEERIAALRSRTYAEAMRIANEQFEQERLTLYPYLSPGLFLFVGSRPAPGAYERQVATLFAPEESFLSETTESETTQSAPRE